MNRDIFIYLKKLNPVKVILSDDFQVTAYEQREVQIDLSQVIGNMMTTLSLSKVSYILEASMNLIACGQLDA